MSWICAEKHNKATAHYFERGVALCGRVQDLEAASGDGTEKAPVYACGSCKQKLRIRKRRVNNG